MNRANIKTRMNILLSMRKKELGLAYIHNLRIIAYTKEYLELRKRLKE